MERNERKNGLIGKKLIVVFEDARDHYARKTGTCTLFTDTELILDDKHLLPIGRIIRAEVID
ncbi:hypothetical protein GF327_09580 [Candidatus Woesearchaeota archaeon]|nr:hypothetical protein [Candidatus Woesearchaeota archaeon]